MVFFLLGFTFLFNSTAFAACNGEGARWSISPRPKEEPYGPGADVVVEGIITNFADEGGFKWFRLGFNGWRTGSLGIEEGTQTLGTPGDQAMNGSTLQFTPVEEAEKPAWKVKLILKLTSGYLYANNIQFTWTGTDEQPHNSCELGTTFYFQQSDACYGGPDSGSTWILTTGDTKYSPGSIAVTSVNVRDWQGITDDISFFFDGWEFEYGKPNDGWTEGSEMIVTGQAGDTNRTITMKVPIMPVHADGPHRISYSWAIKDSYRRCSTRNIIYVSNPSVPAGTGNTGGTSGKIMPKTGLFDEGNKMIILGVGLVILGITWTFIFRIIRKSREAYLSISAKVSGKVSKISNQISKEVKVAKARTAKKKVENRRSRFEKRI